MSRRLFGEDEPGFFPGTGEVLLCPFLGVLEPAGGVLLKRRCLLGVFVGTSMFAAQV